MSLCPGPGYTNGHHGGHGKGAENNILIKDAESLEVAYKVNAVILDKTGTITIGKPGVTNELWNVDNDHKNHYRRILYNMETLSEHPLASAITSGMASDYPTNFIIDEFTSITGRGVKGNVDGTCYYAGNKKLLDENNIIVDDELYNKAISYEAVQRLLFISPTTLKH